MKKAGHEAHVWSMNGMRMVVLRDGGRVLGLYAPDSEESFFWNNPRIFDDARLVWKERWPNPGGDRCWLSPVCTIGNTHGNPAGRYNIPWRVDPGYHDVERWKGGDMRLCNVGKIFLHKTRKKDTFALERYLSWTENPLRHMEEDRTRDLSYAGYSQKTRLESFSCNKNNLSIWNILQLPIGGEIVVPVYGRSSLVRSTLGIKNTDFLKVSDGKIQIKAGGENDCLISIPPQMSTGRIGYVRQEGRQWILVVRNFQVNPSGEYMNCFSGSTGKPGYAVQCRSVSDGEASHVELHHHVPANSFQVIYDTSQTWCFRGSRKNILHAAACLTGYELVPSSGIWHRTGGL